MDLQFAGQAKAGVLIKLNIAFHLQQADTHCPGLLQRILQKFEAIALTFVIRMDADGAESPGRERSSVG